MIEETLSFRMDVSRMPSMIRWLHRDKQAFVREMIANASDACDRLRHKALGDPALIEDDPAFRMRIDLDSVAMTIAFSVNCIGKNSEGLIAYLGTIARSR